MDYSISNELAAKFVCDDEKNLYTINGYKVKSLFSNAIDREKHKKIDVLWFLLNMNWSKKYNSVNPTIVVDLFYTDIWVFSTSSNDVTTSSGLEKEIGGLLLLRALDYLNKYESPVKIDIRSLGPWFNMDLISTRDYNDRKIDVNFYKDFSDGNVTSFSTKVPHLDYKVITTHRATIGLLAKTSENVWVIEEVELNGGQLKVNGDVVCVIDKLYTEESKYSFYALLCKIAKASDINTALFKPVFDYLLDYYSYNIYTSDIPYDTFTYTTYNDEEATVGLPFDLSKIKTLSAYNINRVMHTALSRWCSNKNSFSKVEDGQFIFLVNGPANPEHVGSFPLEVDRQTRELLGEDVKLIPYFGKLLYSLQFSNGYLTTTLGNELKSVTGLIRLDMFKKAIKDNNDDSNNRLGSF